MIKRIIDSSWFYFVLAGVLLVAGILSQLDLRIPSRSVAEPSEILALSERDDLNVVFILIDTLRADHLGAWGYGRNTSPVMDGLANYGIRFASVESQSSWTKCSMASLWLGANPQQTGVIRFSRGASRRCSNTSRVVSASWLPYWRYLA